MRVFASKILKLCYRKWRKTAMLDSLNHKTMINSLSFSDHVIAFKLSEIIRLGHQKEIHHRIHRQCSQVVSGKFFLVRHTFATLPGDNKRKIIQR